MTQRLIKIHASKESAKSIEAAIKKSSPVDFFKDSNAPEDRISYSVLVESNHSQPLIDSLETILGHNSNSRIVVLPVEATWPESEEPEKKKKSSVAREELYQDVMKGSVLDWNFILLAFFSTIVAAIGLLEDNIAAVLGAMVIAPLLGPNLALALGTTLGDIKLISRSLKTNAAGLSFSLIVSIIIGILWQDSLDSPSLLDRTKVGYDSIALALASGAAAALSLTTGVSSVLVGVMVAVALLPPAATLGIFLGTNDFNHAAGAFILLCVNVVCVNISAKIVFLFKGVKPRTWNERKKAKTSTIISILSWFVALGILATTIYLLST